MRAKSRNVKKFSYGHKRGVTKFGELLTLDVHDHATKYKAALPVSSYESDEVVTAIREFLGSQKATA
eukprot:347228-Lingulodinium_polyedra.AAC.1